MVSVFSNFVQDFQFLRINKNGCLRVMGEIERNEHFIVQIRFNGSNGIYIATHYTLFLLFSS